MKFQKEMLTLYAVTDRTWLNGRTLAEVVEQVIAGGATMVQLREKGKSEAEILQSAREIQPICRKYGVPFIVNDSIELARRVGADGVHLGQSDVPEGDVRKLAQGLILGLSANTVESAQRAAALSSAASCSLASSSSFWLVTSTSLRYTPSSSTTPVAPS